MHTRYFEPLDPGSWEFEAARALHGPEVVDFGQLLEGQRRQQRVRYRNVGSAPLSLESWEISPEFELRFPGFVDGQRPTVLGPGQAVEVDLAHRAVGRAGAQGKLVIRYGEGGSARFTTALLANVERHCLQVEPADGLDFGAMPLGGRQVREVVLINCSELLPLELEVGPIEAAEEGAAAAFRLREDGPLREGRLVMEPADRVRLVIEADARELGLWQAQLPVRPVGSELEPRQIALQAEVVPDCPQAVIRASAPGRGAVQSSDGELRVEPLDTVQLDAGASADLMGREITHWRWTLLARPDDSTVRFEEQERKLPRAALFADLHGDYIVELHVWNEDGQRSCQPAQMVVRSISSHDVHLQLVWSTPTDNDPHDEFGTDVDLHFLNRRITASAWNKKDGDIYWLHKTAEWGDQRRTSDNPRLDIDDRDGDGPENIHLNQPEVRGHYSIGAFYFDDSGLGRIFATVRVYIQGRLAGEMRQKPLDEHEFWYVLDLRGWPEPEITAIDDVSEQDFHIMEAPDDP